MQYNLLCELMDHLRRAYESGLFTKEETRQMIINAANELGLEAVIEDLPELQG